MLARMQLSDLHLGDPRSVLSRPEVARAVALSLAELSEGRVGKLVLAGDAHEECVPRDLDSLADGVAASVAEASRNFFGTLFSETLVDEVVWVPGNHDLCVWSWYQAQRKREDDVVTPYEGVEVDRSEWPWRDLYPGLAGGFKVAYPLYWDRAPGEDYPLLLTTHGHLLDPLVLGWDSEASYMALRALGCPRPEVPREDEQVSSLRKVARDTLGFVLSVWERYSARDFAYANYVMRRLERPRSSTLRERVGVVRSAGDDSPAGEGYASNLPWLLGVLTMDPELPSLVGELGRGLEEEATRRPSCLTFGHDHLGTLRDLDVLGAPWSVVDSGGWTSEYDGHCPHARVLTWKTRSQVVPDAYFVGTGGTS